jgi:Mn2+/Fe2+ NRAMP family transporter
MRGELRVRHRVRLRRATVPAAIMAALVALLFADPAPAQVLVFAEVFVPSTIPVNTTTVLHFGVSTSIIPDTNISFTDHLLAGVARASSVGRVV